MDDNKKSGWPKQIQLFHSLTYQHISSNLADQQQ